MTASPPEELKAPGKHERHIARGTLAQQVSQAYGVVVMLVVVTLLARTLTLEEFGIYGLLVTLSSYLLVLQASVEGATVRAIAQQGHQHERNRVFSTALAIYGSFGLVAGIVIAAGGNVLIGLLNVPADLQPATRAGFVALGVVTATGWPFRAFQDALRGTQRFVASSVAEILANTLYATIMVLLITLGAPLWLVVGAGGSLPILLGVAAAIVLLTTGRAFRLRPSLMGRDIARDLLGFSAWLSAIGIADVVIYSLDRVILAAFRSPAAVGLYEGAARPHALIRQLHGTLVVTVVPVASSFIEERDQERLDDLLLRGTRYVLAVIVPLTVMLMVLSGPILTAWLGPEFDEAAPAMTILVSYWLVAANTGIAGAMLVAAGKVKELTRYAWAGAILNLGLSLALTPSLGLNGVVIGTALPYFLLTPYFIRIVLATFPMSVGRLARKVWLPAYATGSLVAVVLIGLRLLVPLDTLPAVIAAAIAALGLGWLVFYAGWLDDQERRLFRTLLRRTAPS